MVHCIVFIGTCCAFTFCTLYPASRLQATRRQQLKRKSQSHKHKHNFSCDGSACRPTCFLLLQPWASIVRGNIKSICGKLNFLPEGKTLRLTCDGWATVLYFVLTSGQSGYKWREEVVVHSSTSPSFAWSKPWVWSEDTPELVKLGSAVKGNHLDRANNCFSSYFKPVWC